MRYEKENGIALQS